MELLDPNVVLGGLSAAFAALATFTGALIKDYVATLKTRDRMLTLQEAQLSRIEKIEKLVEQLVRQ